MVRATDRVAALGTLSGSPPALTAGATRDTGSLANVRFGCAPWKGGVFQWVQAPLGDRSSRKQSEQSWR